MALTAGSPAVADFALPHGLRPAIVVPDAAPAPPAAAEPVDSVTVCLLIALCAMGLAAWWWNRRRSPQRPGAGADDPVGWQALAEATGQADWYQRLGRRISVRYGTGRGGNGDVSVLLDIAARRDASGAWTALLRRWEWATYGGYPGQASEHQSDLAVARRGWP